MTIAEGFCAIQCHVVQKMQYTFLNTQTDTQVTSLRSVQSRQNGTLVRHVSGQEAWHGLVTTLGGSSIASQSRIFASNMENHVGQKSNSTQLPALAIWWSQPPELAIWRSGPSTLHSLLSSRYGDRVQAQSTSTGACDLQFASRHGSIRSWQR